MNIKCSLIGHKTCLPKKSCIFDLCHIINFMLTLVHIVHC
uniref:Uncharacterized protein n=1 Tax=Anguilla anguilla TaxID=7936 RepID=A0A0E9Q4D1_ANGAN